jgi:hypothetical protein
MFRFIARLLKTWWSKRPKRFKDWRDVCSNEKCNRDPEFAVWWSAAWMPKHQKSYGVGNMSPVCAEHLETMRKEPEKYRIGEVIRRPRTA